MHEQPTGIYSLYQASKTTDLISERGVQNDAESLFRTLNEFFWSLYSKIHLELPAKTGDGNSYEISHPRPYCP